MEIFDLNPRPDVSPDKVAAQMTELAQEIGKGSINPAEASQALRRVMNDMIVPRSNWNKPSWWRGPESQLVRAKELWPGVVLPEPPTWVSPRTSSEVLLLHVPDSFESLWRKVVGPDEYTKCDKRFNWDGLKLAPWKTEFTEPVWLGFDPWFGSNKANLNPHSVLHALQNFAASEVLSALIQFPEWPLGWTARIGWTCAPVLLGYQVECDSDGDWPEVPFIDALGDEWEDGNQLVLNHMSDGNFGGNTWAWPTVREC